MGQNISKLPSLSIGQKIQSCGDHYILAMVARNKVCAINLKTGNRFNEAAIVQDPCEITQEELKQILQDEFVEEFFLL